MRIERVQRAAHNMKIWTVASDLPWTPSHVRLPVEPSIRIQQNGAWKELGGVIIGMLVSGRRLANDDCKSLKKSSWAPLLISIKHVENMVESKLYNWNKTNFQWQYKLR